MSPSMPITIVSSASAPSSAASSPSSSTSSSSAGVYVPVHRRALPSAQAPKRTLPIYTPAELMGLAQSPLARKMAVEMHGALHGQEVALSRKQQRTREYLQRQAPQNEVQTRGVALRDNTNTTADTDTHTSSVVLVPAVAQRRRPVGRAAERSNSRRNGASKFIDAASWRTPVPRQPVA